MSMQELPTRFQLVLPSCQHARPSSLVESQRVFEIISPTAIARSDRKILLRTSGRFRLRLSMLSRASLAILLVARTIAANAQEIENRQVVVEAEELPSAVLRPIYRTVASISRRSSERAITRLRCKCSRCFRSPSADPPQAR